MRGRAAPVVVVAFQWLTGCGGGLPLLHPAQTLAPGDMRAAAGFGANIATGSLADAVSGAIRDAQTNPNAPKVDEAYANGALVAASVAPGLAPFVSARVGIAGHVEGGLAYMGRSLRADARRSFEISRTWSWSLGAGGTAVLSGRPVADAPPGVNLAGLYGWGADVPLLLGYASDADLYRVWLGARGGGEHIEVGRLSSLPEGVALAGPRESASVSANHFWAGALLGVAAGFRHVHVAIEMDVAYATLTGEYAGTHGQVTGVTISPATALWCDF